MVQSTNQSKPKATRQDYQKYLDLKKQLKNSDDIVTRNNISNELYALKNSLDWFDELFEENGKWGLKNVFGETVLPAMFDSIGECWRIMNRPSSIAVCIDGKWGLANTGTGEMRTEARYKRISRYAGMNLFLFWNEGSEKYGLMYGNGKEMLSCCLDSICEPFNNIIEFESDGRKGCYCMITDICIKPEYDAIDIDVDKTLIFFKDGVEGYVHQDGRFFSLDYIKRMETDPTLEYIEVSECLYNTYDY